MSHLTYNAFMNKLCLAPAQSAWALLLLLVISILKSAEAQTAQPLLEPCSGEACGKFTISTNDDLTEDPYCSINYIWYQNLPSDEDACWCADSWTCGTGEYAQVWFNNDWYSISQVGVRGCAWKTPEYVKTFKVGYHDGLGWKFVGGSTYESATLYNSSSTCSEKVCTDGTPNDIPATSCKGIRLYPMSAHQSCSTNMEIYGYPISSPTSEPTLSPTVEPTKVPTNSPTDLPSASPTVPTASPTQQPTTIPTTEPSTEMPITSPSQRPTGSPIVPLLAVIETTTDTAASTSAPPTATTAVQTIASARTTSMPSLESGAATSTVAVGSACGGVLLCWCCLCTCAFVYGYRRIPNNRVKQIASVDQHPKTEIVSVPSRSMYMHQPGINDVHHDQQHPYAFPHQPSWVQMPPQNNPHQSQPNVFIAIVQSNIVHDADDEKITAEGHADDEEEEQSQSSQTRASDSSIAMHEDHWAVCKVTNFNGMDDAEKLEIFQKNKQKEIDDGANKKPEGIRASVAVENASVADNDSDSEQVYGSQHNEQQSTMGATPMTTGAVHGAHSHISETKC